MTRVAYFTPLNPKRSGISDYNEELLPYLGEYLDIDLFVDDYWPSNSAITQRFKVLNYRKLAERRADYDVCVYHMGNNPQHILIYDILRKFPGVVILHDGILHHLFLQMALNLNRQDDYRNEFIYAYGAAGLGLAEYFLRNTPQPYDYPMIYGVANYGWAILTHNQFIKRRLEVTGITTPIHQVPFPFDALDNKLSFLSEPSWRNKYNLSPDTLLIASFGQIIPGKRIQQSLRAYAAIRQNFPNTVYCLVGEAAPDAPVHEWIREAGLLPDAVIVTGHVSFNEFLHAIADTDICVNLRYPTTGETSASLIRVLGMGCPTIVSNVGSYAELPEDICIKISPGEHEQQILINALTRLASDVGFRLDLGKKASHYIRVHHEIRDAARIQAEIIRNVQPRLPEPLPVLLPMRPVRYLDNNQWPNLFY